LNRLLDKSFLTMALTVARQPATDVDFALAVASYAKGHEKDLALNPVHVLDLAVALLAGNLLSYVTLMVEQDVLSQVVRLFPGRGCASVVISMFFQNLRMFGDDVFMAI
jgi:hypothetical protein